MWSTGVIIYVSNNDILLNIFLEKYELLSLLINTQIHVSFLLLKIVYYALINLLLFDIRHTYIHFRIAV